MFPDVAIAMPVAITFLRLGLNDTDLGLILAHADLVAEQGEKRPIVLLDEVAAHLDPLRRAALFDRLAAAGGQTWMTGTEPGLFADAPAAATRLIVAGTGIAGA